MRQFPGRGVSLAAPIMALDHLLRRRQDITEYSTSRDCVLRMQIIDSEENVALSDGCKLSEGDRLVDLHLWNEQVPLVPSDGVSWRWGQSARRSIEFSLGELARHLRAQTGLDDIRVIRARIGLESTLGDDQIIRLARRFGFEPASTPPRRAESRLHWFGENILITLLILAQNPAALRIDSLWRGRVTLYLSRRTLEGRYGADEDGASSR